MYLDQIGASSFLGSVRFLKISEKPRPILLSFDAVLLGGLSNFSFPHLKKISGCWLRRPDNSRVTDRLEDTSYFQERKGG